MPKMRLVALIVLVLGGAHLGAATYYVDQTNGNDANTGTSPTGAWKNAPGMAAYSGSGSLQPGDTVYFDSADTWPVSGLQGIYLVGGVTYIGNEWGSGARAHLRASANLEVGVVRFTDHATRQTVLKGFDVDANGKVAAGIDINHRYSTTAMLGATKRVEDCEVHGVGGRLANGQYKYGIIVSNHWGAAYNVANVEIINTVVHDTSRGGILLYTGDEYAGNLISNLTVRGCETYNTGQDPDYSAGAGITVKGHVQDAYVEYNYTHDTNGAGIFVNGNETNHYGTGQENIHIRYNVVTSSSQHGAILVYDTSVGDPKDIKIYGNLVYNSPAAGLSINGLQNTLQLLVYNNTFYNAFLSTSGSNKNKVAAFELKNNIIYYPGSNAINDSSGLITASSNNITTNPLFKNTALLPDGFTGSYGVDLTPNADGLSLQPASAALGTGAGLPAAFSGSINTVTRTAGAWDVGAYQSSGAPPANEPPSAPRNVRIIGSGAP